MTSKQIRVPLPTAERLEGMISGEKKLRTIGDVVQYLIDYYDKTRKK
jgi:hypothetical protein